MAVVHHSSSMEETDTFDIYDPRLRTDQANHAAMGFSTADNSLVHLPWIHGARLPLEESGRHARNATQLSSAELHLRSRCGFPRYSSLGARRRRFEERHSRDCLW